MDIKIKRIASSSQAAEFDFGDSSIVVDFDDLRYEDLISLAEEVAHHQGEYRASSRRLIEALEFLNENEK